MRLKAIPEDFCVAEVLAIPLEERGPYAVYRVKKRALPTLEVQAALAQRLGLPPSAVQFPALKDKMAIA
ncbi:MAG: tRNA pseudouridine(13) synthase TruD, partial [Candidatus Bipolaricaulaceae bacterium]